MKSDLSSTQYCHSWGDLLRSHAILSSVPKSFRLKTSSSRGLSVNPALTPDKLVPLVKGWKVVMATDSTILYRSKTALLQVAFSMGRVDLQVLSSGFDAEALAVKTIAPFEKFKFENKEDGGVWVNFSYSSPNMGVERNTQFIRCPIWSEIKDNYPSNCRSELDRLMGMKRPWNEGRLLIWHGEPGTGKTFGIRALLMAWRDRFNFVVVTDPEKMLASPSYYYEIASAPNMNSVPGAPSQDDDDDSSTSKKKRILFIVEDSADLIAVGSRKQHWDKFGKLLNVTDGLIGQGREDVFLFTFNEALGAIDPAMVRPGRCISRTEFSKFHTEDAMIWLSKNGLGNCEPSGADTLEPCSLAELYQMKAKAKSQKNVPVTV